MLHCHLLTYFNLPNRLTNTPLFFWGGYSQLIKLKLIIGIMIFVFLCYSGLICKPHFSHVHTYGRARRIQNWMQRYNKKSNFANFTLQKCRFCYFFYKKYRKFTQSREKSSLISHASAIRFLFPAYQNGSRSYRFPSPHRDTPAPPFRHRKRGGRLSRRASIPMIE